MAQTLVSLYVHIIFSTKYRQNIILPKDEPDLFAYMGESRTTTNQNFLQLAEPQTTFIF